jgi:hypothetical protein
MYLKLQLVLYDPSESFLRLYRRPTSPGLRDINEVVDWAIRKCGWETDDTSTPVMASVNGHDVRDQYRVRESATKAIVAIPADNSGVYADACGC